MTDIKQEFSVSAAKVGILIRKELFVYAAQPIIYIAAAVMTAVCAVQFFIGGQVFVPGIGTGDLRFFFSAIPYISVLTVPVLTMGQWDAEAYLFETSLPVSELQLVFAKWAAAVCAGILMLIPGISVPICLSLFADVSPAQLFTGYIGIICFTAAACAAGLFFAVCFSHKIASFICTALVLALSNSAHLLPLYAPLPQWLTNICNYISFAWHFDAFGKGIIDTRDIVFYAVAVCVCLGSSAVILTSRKRGCL